MPHETISPHVLVVGIEGVRYDALRAATTPALDSIEAAPVLLPGQVHAKNGTVSSPVWSTVATGGCSDRHGVLDNSTPSPRMAGRDDFTAAARPAGSMVAASWYPLVTDSRCGPIFSSRGWFPPTDAEGTAGSAAGWTAAEDAVASYAAPRLAEEALAVSFVYFGEADEIAHRMGAGREYTAAIDRGDQSRGSCCGPSKPGPHAHTSRGPSSS